MYILQIKQATDTWIVAICQIEEDATTYLKTLPAEIQADSILLEVPIEYYPFIIIQNTQLPHNSDSYFEYCDFETLQSRIDDVRKNRTDSEEHIYFNYYYISEPYSQYVTNENFMKYMRYTSVTNHVLEQPYSISFFHEEVKRNASNYDIDRLDQLFEYTKTRFTSSLEKEDLALNGYESLFWDMNYDHACGKLTESGISYLIPMVEKMEILLGEKKWKHRSFALHILLDEACKEKSETALVLLKDTIESFEQYLISEPEEKLEIHRLVSLSYQWMMKTDADTAFQFWQHALSEIEKAIDYNPEKASWSLLFELIYTPYDEDQKITDAQIDAQTFFNAKAQKLEAEFGASISYPVALAYKHLQDHLEWIKAENIFPETVALRWAEKAIAFNPDEITRMDLHECAQFFNQIGSKTKRVDFLVKTISLYERALKADIDYAMEVYYIANLWKEIAEIHIENKDQVLADETIKQAKLVYEKNINQIKTSFSAYQHYGDFMVYCYTYEGDISKPTIAELKIIAEEIEIEGAGFYSSPYELFMRIALFEKNENQAILECTKSLILHELCADSTFNLLLEEFADSTFNQLKDFLHETKFFMEEVDTNYYYDPEIKWKKLRTMSSEEILIYWKNRKEEIRNRPPHRIE